MRLLSINKELQHHSLDITSIAEAELSQVNISDYAYIIISGGDGTIRRVVKMLKDKKVLPNFILNPTGSFNVIAKMHHVPKLQTVLNTLSKGEKLKTKQQKVYNLNDEVFLFSAGNMGDLQHIFLSETLRFGILKYGITKYILAVLFLLPIHIVMTPFMLSSKRKFFIFTPLSLISKFGSFYGKIEKEIVIDLDNNYNYVELDGDVVNILESTISVKPLRTMDIATL